MQPAVFIARLIGPVFIALAIGIVLNGPFYTALMEEATRSPTLIYFSGLTALVSGLTILNFHRSWRGWGVIITVLGWLWVLGGLIRLILPATTAALALEVYANPIVLLILAAIVLIVGGVLTFFGYRKLKV